MKGLERIPSSADLTRASEALLFGEVSEADLATYAQWTRFDPQLGEIWISRILKSWRDLSPAHLNHAIRNQPWPAALGVLLELATELGETRDPLLFKSWADCALSGVQPHPPAMQYFIGTRAFAGKLMREDAAKSLEPYSRWGFIGRESLFNKSSFKPRTLISSDRRRAVLNELVATRPRLTVADYRQSLDGWVTPRQAELDLANHPGLRRVGNTRARFYVPHRDRRNR